MFLKFWVCLLCLFMYKAHKTLTQKMLAEHSNFHHNKTYQIEGKIYLHMD